MEHVLDDEIGLGNDDQQGNVGPGKQRELVTCKYVSFVHAKRPPEVPCKVDKIIFILNKISTRISKFKIKIMVYNIEFYAFLPKT